MSRLRMGLIGSRGHVHYVIAALPSLPEIEVTAVSPGCGDSPDRLLQMARGCGFEPRCYADYLELLDREKPDLVSVDGPFELHAAMCVEALKRGIHVFCEKPIALTFEDLERVERAYRAAPAGTKLISMVGLRAEPPFRAAHAAVAAGRVGRVLMVNTRKSYKLGSRPEFYRHRATYGGTIPWVGSHALDWIQWFGGAGFRTLDAIESREENRGHGELEMTALCTCVLENGVMGSASIDYLRPSGAPTHGDDQVRVAGTLGVVEVARGRVTLIDADGEKELEAPPAPNIFGDFAASLLNGTACIADAASTFELTRACLAARESADRKLGLL